MEPFTIVWGDPPGPVVVDIPHAGLVIDERSGQFTVVPPEATEVFAMEADADLGADLVWSGTERVGVTRVVASIHRYVIDLNADPHPPPAPPFYEVDPEPKAIIRRSAAGVSWRAPALSRAEVRRRVQEILEPYHAALDEALARARSRHGRAVMIASHTFPEKAAVDADVVLGTLEGKTLEVEVRDAVADVFRSEGLSVALERPFPGGYSVRRHGRPAEGIGTLQIEIARRQLQDPGNPRRPSEQAVERFQGLMARTAEAVQQSLAVT